MKLAEYIQMLETEKAGVELFADAMDFGETAYIQELFPQVDLGMHCPAKDINRLADAESRAWRYTLTRMESTLASCQKSNCLYMVLHMNVTAQPLTEDPVMLRERGIERIETAAELAERYGVKIRVENVETLYRKTLLYTYHDYIDLFRQLPQVDALIDVGHSKSHPDTWCQAERSSCS